MSHTPGPWEVRYTADGRVDGIATVSRNGDVVFPNRDAECVYDFESGAEESPVKSHTIRLVITDSGYYPPREADARLIAAAPDLLDQLKYVLMALQSYEEVEDIREGIRQVIAKAEGR